MTTTTLKMIALFFMLIDHIGEFIPGTPVWFHWIGRLSAPIFFYCMAWGFYYTKNRKLYLIRMYLFSVGMAIVNNFANNLNTENYYVSIHNNIFVTLFVSCIIIHIIDTIHSNPQKGKKYLFIFILLELLSTYLILLIDQTSGIYTQTDVFVAILANLFFNEGGIPFVALGVLLYYTKNSKAKIIISYSCFCILYIIFYITNIVARIITKLQPILPEPIYNIIWTIPQIFGIDVMPIYHTRFYELTSYYWMVIFALPFMLLYNNKKGRGLKYFFYCFYPLHIYLLYFIGNLIS